MAVNESFNIAGFIAQIGDKGLLKPNKFRFRIPVPAGLKTNKQFAASYAKTSRDIEYWCESAAIPALVLQLHQVQRYGYGVSNRKPFTPVFNDLPVTFIADADGDTWYFMNDWTKLIVNWDSSKGVNPDTPTSVVNNTGVSTWEVAYWKDYVVDATVDVFNDIGDVIKQITLKDCYPSMVGEIRIDWQDNNNIARIPVTMTFVDWHYN